MKLKKLSLRIRIFFAMILLVLLASILISAVAIYQYKEQSEDYHRERLERKEENIQSHLKHVLNGRQNTWEVKTENIPIIFKEEVYNIADIHKLQINLYDLEGSLLISSKAGLQNNEADQCMDVEILNAISNTASHRYVDKRIENGEAFQSSYTYLIDQKSKEIAILNLPYLEKDDFLTKELEEFLTRIGYAFIFVLLMAIAIAFLLSKYITKSLKTISDKINTTRLEKRNQKIVVNDTSEEISTLVSSYNSMIDELEESAIQLARSEREQAWREMAKQVAHEIKNPLTPMRLTVQNFQRKFDPNDENIHSKLDEYSKTLIQQIDTMSSIASAFSNFANMPAQQNETLNVVYIVKLALEIFNEDYINFTAEKEEIIAKLDRTQLIRVVTNLVKNAIQAMPEDQTPKININVSTYKNDVVIIVSDNGSGILEENIEKVFEPKFTTKTSGMGLGLAMVKNIVETYKGTITFNSEKDKGTVFRVTFPKE
ncbi:Sporulation kinase A [Mariniflexile rhizosphaerae]|uniref:sensor histidine kinase n=1 Tax=unclassified Mariniflexile TaxID=2643887 RepID=UPI000CADAE6A|nr:ATP-binding protein [Mariniflexile sp. TRM1-10]AXP80488.1 Sporulation kinase A [Mariniflexile sp. TRM1-10]PLB20029.1 MAG: Nitrogen regulation protein NtrY [Flavobacteriaceae bacterium FS1-H7996/R]